MTKVEYVQKRKDYHDVPLNSDGDPYITGRLSRFEMEELHKDFCREFSSPLAFLVERDHTYILCLGNWTRDNYYFVEGWLSARGYNI